MSLEAATNISQLNPSNPVGNDQESQGDDHIRMIKAVLQAAFPNATSAFYFPQIVLKSADFSITSIQQNATFLVDCTAAVVTATLPTLAPANAGWECFFIKTDATVNTMFIQPPAGTIQSGEYSGLAKTRRCIPGRRTRVLWTGTAFLAERVVNSPVGAIIDYDGATLPVGYEFPNGQTLGANYPDFILVKGSGLTRDLRGECVFGKDNMGGSTRGKITVAGSGLDGTVQGAEGGAQNVVIANGNLPASIPATFSGTPMGTHTHTYANAGGTTPGTGGGGAVADGSSGVTGATSAGTPAGTVAVNAGGANTALNKMPPAMVLNKLLVVE